ncbi:cell envelope integrity protein CreD [Flavobacterium luminosum]|uniref:Cell envelope integrity protein CreD n=1 Tax=Flavobacterium luminosum TaxID=2949086 RepID=A0ABT0TN17_9FLAO|nr:cell envelope integrity protein CreD [Flavobacterium sp. HXWNR70]MCL9808886.1 cell envelope integrity protein CreD [Flavobacterium sp. HXWNR70]
METQFNQPKNSFFQSTTVKMAMVGFLTLILLIPLEFVKDLISERSNRKKEVVEEVSNLWGKDIYFYGPILKIPYKSYEEYNITNPRTGAITIEKKVTIKNAFFFPENFNSKTDAKKNTSLKRGIYNNVVFTANMDFQGNFGKLNFEKLGIKSEDLLWNQASIVVKTTNLKSIKSDLNIALNNQKLNFESKSDEDNFYGTLKSDKFDYSTLAKSQRIDFKFNMEYNGSNSIKFIPIGKKSIVSLDSDWESPSFEGAFAANDTTKKINKKGFHADWKILDINRSFSQQHIEKIPNLNDYAFGAKLIETVDEYQQNERASKYGFLVIGLTFLVFFLIQSISKITIHIFQYSMIGLALIMFYTLLISITEHSSFKLAYLIAGISVVTMISLYSKSILNKKFAGFIAVALTGLYTFIYVIIQLESYALLVGSIGLFAILGAVMYFSRKIEWK